jgi:putative nucleotidyltransferase with HDIG domain
VRRWTSLRGAEPPAALRGPVVHHGLRVLVLVSVALVTFLLFPASPAVEFPVLEVGAVAPENVIAPFEFRVAKSPEELAREEEDAVRSVVPVFQYVPAALDSARRELDAFMRALAAAVPTGRSTGDRALSTQQAATAQGVTLTAEEAEYLSAPANRAAMREAVGSVIDRELAQGVVSPGALDSVRGTLLLRRDSAERQISADSLMTFGTLLARARLVLPAGPGGVAEGLFHKLLGSFFHPTVVPDRVATEAMRQELRRAVVPDKYVVREGEKIVGAHEVIGREEHEKLRALRDQLRGAPDGEWSPGRTLGSVLLNLLVLSILGATLAIFRPPLYGSLRSVLLIAGVYVAVLAAAAVVANQADMHVELIPIAFAAVVFSVLFDPRFSLIAVMVLALLLGVQNDFRGTNALYFTMLGGVAAAFSVRVIRRRNQAYSSILAIAAAYILASVALGLTLDREMNEVLCSAAFGALNATVCVSLAMIVLPPLEELTGIDTYLKLLEWSDLNRPIMQRLSLEAPGTYAHTIAMANLVESAANAIGANGLLARVGTYYHDIGKLKKPQYFVENQPKGRNPHDKLKPAQSAAIIRNHIRDGLQLAEQHKLPRAVRAFIAEHHGTGTIAYFLEKARERDGSVASPAEYGYPGPVPQSAETAICMLADGVEASMRVLSDPTPEKIREVIDHIVRQRMEAGQLRDAPLTLRQLEAIKREFARVLTGMYHNRIDYPAASGGVTSEFASV